MSAADKWFHRGKEARGLGLDRVIRDGRLSPESRRRFFAGWDEENRLHNQPSDDERDESNRVAGKLREFAKTL